MRRLQEEIRVRERGWGRRTYNVNEDENSGNSIRGWGVISRQEERCGCGGDRERDRGSETRSRRSERLTDSNVGRAHGDNRRAPQRIQ